MKDITYLTNKQARQFLLLKHGLLGTNKFIGKQGVLDFIRQVGCIQFDPVDSCGKNAELTLQSRIKNFSKQDLYDLLYKERNLIDYPDKNLSIFLVDDWPYFQRYRNAAKDKGKCFSELDELEKETKEYIEKNGPVCSDDLPLQGKIHWHSAIHWSGDWIGNTSASRAVLEQLYSTGELIIHHKEGTRKYYDLTYKYLPEYLINTPEPLYSDYEHQKWRVLRRIGAVGLLWNKASDALLNIWGLKANVRSQIFSELLFEGKIIPVKVEGISYILYCQSEDEFLLKTVLDNKNYKPRCEFLAPLDCLLWDRKLIKEIFKFEYTWEIYTPADKRKYGFYVLPILYGDCFVGRIEAVVDAKVKDLIVKNIWYEDQRKITKKLSCEINKNIRKFADFNQCNNVKFENVDDIY